MKIIDCIQGSDQWLAARLGIVTASEIDALISPLWKPRTGQGIATYVTKKIAERWRGAPLTSYHGGSMEQGTIREDEAFSWYELNHDVNMRKVGFITTDDGVMGCSPDGLGEDFGIEIKCPEPHTHVGWLLEGGIPSEHRAQVYGGMYVTGLPRWTFLSYCRGFPPLVITVERDEAVMIAIGEAVSAFQTRLNAAWNEIVARNGGPPVRVTAAQMDPEYVF